MEVYYEIPEGSETYNKLSALIESADEAAKAAAKIAARLGSSDKKQFARDGDGYLIGFKFATKPEGWCQIKGMWGWFKPKRTKANKQLIGDMKLRFLSAVSITECVFGSCRLHFEGLSLTRSVGYEEISGRRFVSFKNRKHEKTYKDAIPADIAPVKLSEIIALKESLEEQCA